MEKIAVVLIIFSAVVRLKVSASGKSIVEILTEGTRQKYEFNDLNVREPCQCRSLVKYWFC